MNNMWVRPLKPICKICKRELEEGQECPHCTKIR